MKRLRFRDGVTVKHRWYYVLKPKPFIVRIDGVKKRSEAEGLKRES